MFDSRANKFGQSDNKSERSLLDLDSNDSSASNGLGLVIGSSVLLEVLSILEVLFTENASDGLKLVICSSVIFEVVFILELRFIYRKCKANLEKNYEANLEKNLKAYQFKVYIFAGRYPLSHPW